MKKNEEKNKDYLSKQIITYLGNKRSLLPKIEKEIKKIQKNNNEYEKNGMKILDLFSGSGIVARMLKKYSSHLFTNDLESYSKLLNDVFLTNKNDFDHNQYNKYKKQIDERLKNNLVSGIITKNYAPKDDNNIKANERVFYTNKNAKIIDTIRDEIENIPNKKIKKYFLASLIQKASIHNNTGGMFKGFYKDRNTKIGKFGGLAENALKRIKGEIKLEKPILSEYDCKVTNYQMDSNKLVKKIKNLDITYIDPPYNQHPYGSNYFMLNLIINNVEKKNISKVSGIVSDWNRSKYNKKRYIFKTFENLIKNLDSKYIIISYNSEGFLSYEDIEYILKKYGKTSVNKINYNTYRGSRNLYKRNIHLQEYIFVLETKKGEKNNGKFKTIKRK